jgi:hypothetical protein
MQQKLIPTTLLPLYESSLTRVFTRPPQGQIEVNLAEGLLSDIEKDAITDTVVGSQK